MPPAVSTGSARGPGPATPPAARASPLPANKQGSGLRRPATVGDAGREPDMRPGLSVLCVGEQAAYRGRVAAARMRACRRAASDAARIHARLAAHPPLACLRMTCWRRSQRLAAHPHWRRSQEFVYGLSVNTERNSRCKYGYQPPAPASRRRYRLSRARPAGLWQNTPVGRRNGALKYRLAGLSCAAASVRPAQPAVTLSGWSGPWDSSIRLSNRRPGLTCHQNSKRTTSRGPAKSSRP